MYHSLDFAGSTKSETGAVCSHLNCIISHFLWLIQHMTATMDTLPSEVLEHIVYELPLIEDVRQFRCVNKRFAHAGFPRVLRHIHIIDTLDCYTQIDDLQASPYGSLRATKELTVYYGYWPKVSSQEDWLNHPLSIGGQKVLSCTSADIGRAFTEYQRFIHQEISRNQASNAARFSNLLSLFANVSKLSVVHIHSWRWGTLTSPCYQSLTNRIWMIPHFECYINEITWRLLTTLHEFPGIKHVSLKGHLSMSDYSAGHICSHVTQLSIESLMVNRAVKPNIAQFLMSFPSLKELNLRVVPAAALEEPILPLESLNWPGLRHVSFKGMESSDEELMGFVSRHRLDTLSLQQTKIVGGSWKSVFTGLRQRPDGAKLGATGSDKFVACDMAVYDLLQKFLATDEFPWPFQSCYQLDSDFLIHLS